MAAGWRIGHGCFSPPSSCHVTKFGHGSLSSAKEAVEKLAAKAWEKNDLGAGSQCS